MTSDEILKFVRTLATHYPLRKVHLTGGEPLTRPDVVDLVAALAQEGGADLALTTNGQRLAAMAAGLRRAGLARINISLDSLDAETYRRLTRGASLAPVIAGIEAARQAGFAPIKLNMVVLRGVNDHEVTDVARWGLERGCQVRLLELMPIGVARPHFDEWFVPTSDVQEQLAAAFDIRPIAGDGGSSSRNFLARSRNGGASGIIGFISPCSDSFCAGCRRLRLTADGRLLGCLAQPDGANIRDALCAAGAECEARLVAAVEAALGLKRAGRRFAAQGPMIAVGG